MALRSSVSMVAAPLAQLRLIRPAARAASGCPSQGRSRREHGAAAIAHAVNTRAHTRHAHAVAPFRRDRGLARRPARPTQPHPPPRPPTHTNRATQGGPYRVGRVVGGSAAGAALQHGPHAATLFPNHQHELRTSEGRSTTPAVHRSWVLAPRALPHNHHPTQGGPPRPVHTCLPTPLVVPPTLARPCAAATTPPHCYPNARRTNRTTQCEPQRITAQRLQLFFALLLGAPLALLCKTANTPQRFPNHPPEQIVQHRANLRGS